MRGVRLILIVNLLFLTVESFAQVDTAWVRRYNGPGNGDDVARALALDDSGKVYVTGYSTDSVTSEDYATIKYSPSGDTLWVRRYNGPVNDYDEAYALAADDSGNVYVTGYSWGVSSADLTTIKYSPSGDTLWVRRYNGPNGPDAAYALALDDSGKVYVTGYSRGSGTSDDYATIKYSPSGDTLWVRRYNGPGDSTDVAFALAVDDSGNVYVTGYSRGSGTSDDYATIKYSPSGDTLWVRRYNGPGNVYDAAVALAADGSGNVYVTGFSTGSGTSYDYATIKYVQFACSAKPGDANGTSPISLPDVIHLVNYVFDKDRPATSCLGSDPGNCWTPNPVCQGEVNGTAPISLPDVIHLVNYVFDKDRPATSCLGSSPGNCWTPVASGVCCLPVQ